MKTIDTYIKEAFITKDNIKKMSSKIKRGVFDIDNVTPLPDIKFKNPTDDDAAKFEKWLEENDLMPHIDSIENHNGKWKVYAGMYNGLYIEFTFDDDKVNNNDKELPFLCVDSQCIVRIIHKVARYTGNFDTFELMQRDNILKNEINHLVSHLENILNIEEVNGNH